MSRPSSSVPNQCADEGGSRRAGRWMEAGSSGAIQGANRAKVTKITTRSTPMAASGLWRAFPATRRRIEMAVVDMDPVVPTKSRVEVYGNDESFQNRNDSR